MKTYLSLLAVVAMLFIVGCEESNQEPNQKPTPTPPEEEVEIPEVVLDDDLKFCYLQADATKAIFSFTVDTPWEIKFKTYEGEYVDYVEASPSSGDAGSHTIEVTMPANRDTENRLVCLEVHKKVEGSRSELDDVLNGYHNITLTASILQFGYYELVYGDAIKFKVSANKRLQTLVDEYILEKGITYNDLKYIKLRGSLIEDDYLFIRENLTRLKVVDMFSADIYEIPDNAFLYHSSLHYVILPLQLRRIGNYAFCQTGLKSINTFIPPFLEYVGWNAFADTTIAGTLVFPGSASKIELSGGAFYSEFIKVVIFSDGISTVNGDIVSPFVKLSALYLPSTLEYVACGLIDEINVIYCYPPEPPLTGDPYGLRPGDREKNRLLIPAGSLEDYADLDEDPNTTSDWKEFYSENPQYNMMYDVL